jgi:hypothetical protein
MCFKFNLISSFTFYTVHLKLLDAVFLITFYLIYYLWYSRFNKPILADIVGDAALNLLASIVQSQATAGTSALTLSVPYFKLLCDTLWHITLLYFHDVDLREPHLSFSAFFLSSPSFSHTSSHVPCKTTLTLHYNLPHRTVYPYSPSPVSGATYSVPLPPSSVLVSENFVSRVVDANELSALTSCRLGKITQVRNCKFNLPSVSLSFLSHISFLSFYCMNLLKFKR